MAHAHKKIFVLPILREFHLFIFYLSILYTSAITCSSILLSASRPLLHDPMVHCQLSTSIALVSEMADSSSGLLHRDVLLVDSISEILFFYGTKRAGWPDVKQELSRIEKKEHEFDNAIQSLAATKAHILQTWTKQTSAQNDEFTLHEGFPKFTHSILQELGLKLKYHYDNNSTPIEDRKLINITWTLNPDTAHKVLSCSFATATPLLHSLQQKLPVYNRDNPALWHKKFALPLLEFLRSLNGLTRFSWQFLNPETARKKIGWAPLRGTDQMEAYIAGTQEFTEQIRSILRPRAECVTQLMEVSSVPMVLALIEKDMSKHTFIGLSKPEIEAITRPDSSEPERHAESDAYSASWPFIHSTNDLVFEFYADLYESLVQDEEFRAEAVRVVNGIKGVRNHVSA